MLPPHPFKVQRRQLPRQPAFLLEQARDNAAITSGKGILMLLSTVMHPAGNVAEHLVAAGLARVVDWHAGMLASGGAMERLRAAEKAVKERRLCLYTNVPTATSSGKATGTTSNGTVRSFDATVIRVWSGDQVSVVEKEGSSERRLQLSSTRGPKYGQNFSCFPVTHIILR